MKTTQVLVTGCQGQVDLETSFVSKLGAYFKLEEDTYLWQLSSTYPILMDILALEVAFEFFFFNVLPLIPAGITGLVWIKKYRFSSQANCIFSKLLHVFATTTSLFRQRQIFEIYTYIYLKYLCVTYMSQWYEIIKTALTGRVPHQQQFRNWYRFYLFIVYIRIFCKKYLAAQKSNQRVDIIDFNCFCGKL